MRSRRPQIGRRVRTMSRPKTIPFACSYGTRSAGRAVGRRLWSVHTVLRRVERLVEAEEGGDQMDNPFDLAFEGEEPNA